jgi:ribosome-binding factor A
MQEGKRQKQIGGLIQEELNKIFQRFGLNMINGGMVSISSVKVTPTCWKHGFT